MNTSGFERDKVSISGGCEAAINPHLERDKTLKMVINTYCHVGNGDEYVIRMTLPGKMLDTVRLMVSGYPDANDISLNIFKENDKLAITVPSSGDKWLQVRGTLPNDWKSGLVTIELSDYSKNAWAGVGLASDDVDFNSLKLVLLTVVHALIIVLPMLAGFLTAAYFGVRDLVLLWVVVNA